MRSTTRRDHHTPLFLTRRIATAGALCIGLTVFTWLPSPLLGRTQPGGLPATAARAVSIRSDWLRSKAPAGSLERAGTGVRAVRSTTLRPMAMCPSIRFNAVALSWIQRAGGTIRARISGGPDLRHWGRALETESLEDAPDRGSPDSISGRTGTDLAWLGAAECARIELTVAGGSDLADVRAVFINTEGTANGGPPRRGGPVGPARVLGVPSAEAMTTQPGIISRAKWGANERYRNCGPYYSTRVKMAFVHHTANANSYGRGQSAGIVRAIYWYHTKGLGWCDIAYNMLIDKYGQIFEGRFGGMTKPVMPGATKGFNTGSFAVSAIGNFHIARPPSALIRALKRVLAWRLDWAHVDPSASVWMQSRGSTGNKYPPGVWVRFRTIAGHRDAGFTSCPGKYLYPYLPSIRSAVYAMGLPKIFDVRQKPQGFITGQGSVTWNAYASATMKWILQVRNANDQIVRSWSRRGVKFSLTWDGRTRDGNAVGPGVYRVILSAANYTGKARPAEFTLTIEPVPPCPSPTPSGSPDPSPSPSGSPCPTPSPSVP